MISKIINTSPILTNISMLITSFYYSNHDKTEKDNIYDIDIYKNNIDNYIDTNNCNEFLCLNKSSFQFRFRKPFFPAGQYAFRLIKAGVAHFIKKFSTHTYEHKLTRVRFRRLWDSKTWRIFTYYRTIFV